MVPKFHSKQFLIRKIKVTIFSQLGLDGSGLNKVNSGLLGFLKGTSVCMNQEIHLAINRVTILTRFTLLSVSNNAAWMV